MQRSRTSHCPMLSALNVLIQRDSIALPDKNVLTFGDIVALFQVHVSL